MSLDIARSIAFSGLSATSVQLSVTSSNISNADTTGYTVKTANQSSSVTAGVGTGVTVTGITSTVDKLLLKSLVAATSELGSADTTNTYLTSLGKLYGSTSSTDSSSTGTSLGQHYRLAGIGIVVAVELAEQRLSAVQRRQRAR